MLPAPLFSLIIAKNHMLGTLARRFGGFLFFPLGFLDNSPIPVPGSMDALLIFLTASRKELWWYYAIMATVAAVISSWPTYRLGVKGGKETLDKKLGENRAKKIRAYFERFGFWSIFVGAIAPPPIPCSAFIATAGAMRYPWYRFLASLAMGRMLRFGLLAWVTQQYGRHIFHFFGQYYKPALWTLIVLSVIGGAVALVYWRKFRKKKQQEDTGVKLPQRSAA